MKCRNPRQQAYEILKKNRQMKNILVIALMLILEAGMAQLDFKIENITVSKVIEEMDTNIYIGGFGEGPGISVICSIINNSNDTITLFLSHAEIYVIFTFENTKYCRKAIYSSFIFLNKDSLTVFPNQRFDFNFYDDYLLGTDFHKKNSRILLKDIIRKDNTKEVIATLPTLKVRYKDKNIDIVTDEIKNVIVEDIPRIYKYYDE